MKQLGKLASVVLLATVSTFAQSDRGTITGTVSDPAAAVVPGATVTIRNTETGAVGQTVTTETGNYTLPSLPAGIYDLSVESAGFKKITQTGIQVQVAQTARINVALEVGATSESVTVTAEVPLLKSENAEQSVNVSGDRINALPLNFGGGGGSGGNIRSWTAFAMLSPGVVGNAEGNRINGSQGNNFKIIIEGQDVTSANQVTWTSTVSQASVEMIEEFSLQTANYAAEFGQVAGGLFNFTTRSGTNAFHGTAYEYFTNEALDAYRPFTAIRPLSRKHDAGASVGGPVWIPKVYNGRNRTFFFFNYELFRNRNRAAASFQTLPTDAFRNGNFAAALTGRTLGNDFRGTPVQENVIYDPATSVNIDGRIYRTPFAGNIIPSNRFDPVAVAVQKLIPTNNLNQNLINNHIPNNDTTRTQGLPGIKVDHNFDSTKRMSAYYSRQATDQFTANDGLPVPISAVRVQAIYGITTRFNYDQSITPTLLLHLGVGHLRFHNPDSSPSSVLDYDAVGGIGFRGSATDPAGFPRITGTSTNNFGGMAQSMGPSNANRYWDSKSTGVANVTYIRGNHTFKLGGEYRIDSWTDRNTRGAQGILNFSNAQTGPASATTGQNLLAGNTGFNYASFLLGMTNTASVNAVQDPQWRKNGAALFIQDAWKVTRKLTLDYGLRWDRMSQGHEIWYRNSMFGPSIPNARAGGLLGGIVYEGYGNGRCDCQFTDNYPYAIGPRLGAAYQLDEKSVVRAGVGVIYGNLAGYGYLTNAAILGVGIEQVNWDNPGAGEYSTLMREGLVYNRADLYKVTLDPALRPIAGTTTAPAQVIDRNGARPPRVIQWNLSLQREVARSLVVEAAYVGNRSVWLTQSLVDLNAVSPQRFASFGLDPLNSATDRSLLSSRIDSPAAQARGFRLPYAGFPGASTVLQSIRPFPQFSGGLGPRWAPQGNSWYDSLQVKATKRFSHGLDFSVAYTFAKELSTGSNGDVFNRPNLKALTGGGIPHILAIGFNYELPKVGSNNAVRAIVGGWTLGGVLRYQSGSLIGVPGSNNQLNTHIGQGTRMNRVNGEPLFLKDPNCGCIDPYQDLILNPKAWSDPAQGQWGFSAPFYNDFRNSRRPDEQFSIGRQFSLSRWREGMNFQVRAEFFNAFNRLQLATFNNAGNPNATTTRNAQGQLTGGFGFSNPLSGVALPRNGQLVARFRW